MFQTTKSIGAYIIIHVEAEDPPIKVA